MKSISDFDQEAACSAIKATPPFTNYSQEELQTIVNMLEAILLEQGELLFQPPQLRNSLCFLASGAIEIVECLGQCEPIAIFNPPALISPLSFIFPSNALTYAIAKKQSLIYELSAGSFKMLQLSTPALALNIMMSIHKFLTPAMTRLWPALLNNIS